MAEERVEKGKVTKHIDIAEFQSNLPKYLKEAAAGDTLLICENQQPVAALSAVQPARPLGLGHGQGQVLPGFFESLPEDVIESFGGKSA